MTGVLSRGNRPRWLVPVVVIGGIALLVVMPLIGVYNSLVDKETRVDQAFADLDAQLQRRHDLIPNVVRSVDAILEQEREVFRDIAQARQGYAGAQSPEERLEAAERESSALARLLVVVENYPQLRSNENVRDLQVQLEGTENRVQQSRREYNEAVTDYNRSVRRFPRNLLAGIFGFDKKPLFEADTGARDAPEVNFDEDDPQP